MKFLLSYLFYLVLSTVPNVRSVSPEEVTVIVPTGKALDTFGAAVNELTVPQDKNVTLESEDKLSSAELQVLHNAEEWESPDDLERDFPYYLSGFDIDGRPVWVAEFGKFRISPLFQQGPEKIEEFEMYAKKAAARIYRSLRLKNDETRQLVGIIDFEGLPMSLFHQVPTLRLLVKIAKEYRSLLEDHVARAYVINVSFPAQTLINLARPMMGRLLERVEIYGTNKAQWQRALRAEIIKDQLPEWYGGSLDHVPAAVYG